VLVSHDFWAVTVNQTIFRVVFPLSVIKKILIQQLFCAW